MIIEFTMLGVPRNWSNFAANRFVMYDGKREWLETTTILGRTARIKAGCTPAEKGHDLRTVQIHQLRRRLLDKDGLYVSNKPIVDGLKTILRRKVADKKDPDFGKFREVAGAALIWDDNEKHCDWNCTQELTGGREQQTRIRITIKEETET